MAREMERMILYRVTVVLQAMVFTDLPAFIIPYLVLYYFIHHYLACLFYCAAGHILFK